MCFTTPVIGPCNVYTIRRPTANNYNNFEDYLNGFSSNVKRHWKFQTQKSNSSHGIQRCIAWRIRKIHFSDVNLTPFERMIPMENYLCPTLDGVCIWRINRKFNEDNNEEAGEHFTPREVIDLMTHIILIL
jgi:type I restriction enzyme M protein